MEKKRVVVGMSGGVDSSLTAVLLKEQGYDVIGITMRLADESRDFEENDRGCCSLGAVADARRVCEIIGIPHYVMDFKELFREKVIDDFLANYAKGWTPNPCIACNRYVKFEGLLARAMELGASYVATGHYARIEQDAAGRWLLKKGLDEKKDQAYALYHLNQHSLAHFLKATIGLRVSAKEEISGLDFEEHGLASAYADFMPVPEVPGSTSAPTPIDSAEAPEPVTVTQTVTPGGKAITCVSIVTARERFEALKNALEGIGITGMTVTLVSGYGLQKGHSEMYRGAQVASKLIPKIQVKVVVSAIPPQTVIDTAKKVLHTGHYGDGKIFVTPVTNVVKIRTGQEGFDALQDFPAKDE